MFLAWLPGQSVSWEHNTVNRSMWPVFKSLRQPLRNPWDTLERPWRNPGHMNSGLIQRQRCNTISKLGIRTYPWHSHSQYIWYLNFVSCKTPVKLVGCLSSCMGLGWTGVGSRESVTFVTIISILRYSSSSGHILFFIMSNYCQLSHVDPGNLKTEYLHLHNFDNMSK